MQTEGGVVCGDGDVCRAWFVTVQKRGDVSGKWLERVRGLGVVVLQEQIPDTIIQSVVEASLALESVSLAQSARLEQELHNFIVAAKTCL